MHAIVRSTYGPPDVLHAATVDTPTSLDDEVRIHVFAASANAGDRHLLRGRPVLVRLMTGGLLWPRLHTLGKDAMLTKRIRQIHENSRGTYGSPRVHAALQAERIHVGKKRVARLMKEAGLRGASRRKRPSTTVSDDTGRPAPDLVDRDFTASGPDELWVADITYVPTQEGYLYLAVVIDVCSRKVVGWEMAGHLRSELVLEALDMATEQRESEETVHHSGQDERVRQAHSIQQSPSASGVRPKECNPRGREATATTTRCASPSSQRSNVN